MYVHVSEKRIPACDFLFRGLKMDKYSHERCSGSTTGVYRPVVLILASKFKKFAGYSYGY